MSRTMGEGTNQVSYTTSKLARLYNIAPNSLKNWEETGAIPPADRTPGGHRRYGQTHIDALNKMFPSNQHKPAASPPSASEASNVGSVNG